MNRRHARGRWLVAALAGSLVASGVWVTGPRANATFGLERLAGADRYGTAANIALASFGSGADTVLLARGELFPDALAGNYSAGHRKSPILLTLPGSVPSVTLDALRTLKAKNVVLLGGTAAIQPAVEQQLRNTESTSSAGGRLVVSRIGAGDRYATAAAVANDPGPAHVGSVDGMKTALVASGLNFPDALAGGPLSFGSRLPTILTDPNALPNASRDALSKLGIQQAIILGGTAAVSATVESQLRSAGMTVVRLAGSNRVETAIKIADYALGKLSFSKAHVNLARGDAFPDALTGGAHGGADGPAPTLLTDSSTALGTLPRFWLEDHASTLANGHVFGGTSALSDGVVNEATAAGRVGPIILNSTTVPQGGVLTGRVANPNGILFVTVSGCGISTPQRLELDSVGRFSLTLPASQGPGACTLTFNINRQDPSQSGSVPVAITVTAPQTGGGTAGPDLLSTTRSGGNVNYVFDAPITSSPQPQNFHIYSGSNGAQSTASQVSVSGSTVTASFPTGLDSATVASVEFDAVRAANGRGNPECSTALQSVTNQSGVTAAPDLIAVGQFESPGGPFLRATFFFDAPVGAINTGNFFLIIDETNPPAVNVAQGSGPPQPSSDQRAVTVTFTPPGGTAIEEISRAVVEQGAVTTQGTPPVQNPRQSYSLANGGRTIGPDLVSVTRNGDKVTYQFDDALDADAGDVNEGAFTLYDANANQQTPPANDNVAPQVSGSAVIVTFAAGVPAAAVGASVNGPSAFPPSNSAVKDASGTPNQDQSAPLGDARFQSGTTGLPDLVSVKRGTSGANKTVTFTFDQDFPGDDGPNGTPASFHLYDAAGNQFTPDAPGTVSGSSVTFAGPSSFTNAEIDAAVVAGVNDSTTQNGGPGLPSPPNPQPKFPEGCAAVT